MICVDGACVVMVVPLMPSRANTMSPKGVCVVCVVGVVVGMVVVLVIMVVVVVVVYVCVDM